MVWLEAWRADVAGTFEIDGGRGCRGGGYGGEGVILVRAHDIVSAPPVTHFTGGSTSIEGFVVRRGGTNVFISNFTEAAASLRFR